MSEIKGLKYLLYSIDNGSIGIISNVPSIQKMGKEKGWNIVNWDSLVLKLNLPQPINAPYVSIGLLEDK